MKLKFIKPEKPIYNKEKLYKIALRIAIEQVVFGEIYTSVSSARAAIMLKAKYEYSKKSNK